MKKFLKGLIFCLLIGCSEKKISPEEQLQQLKERMKELQIEIEALEKEALNDQVEGQGFMFSNYKKFTNELQSAEKREEKARILRRELHALQEERLQLERTQ